MQLHAPAYQMQCSGKEEKENTLKREPIDENLVPLFEDLVVSSGIGGNSEATNGHREAVNSS